MGLRDKLKDNVKRVLDRFSGEYSAGSDEIREEEGGPPKGEPAVDAPVTRARLRRPREERSGDS